MAYSWDTNAPLAQLALESTRSDGGWFSFSSTTAYTYGQGPLGYSTPRESVSYHSDSLGSIVELSDESASSAGSYRYAPYGESWASTGQSSTEAASNPIRFSGQYLDQDSGLYYLRAREYDPETGRFLQLDPMEEEVGETDLSDYLYAADNPTLLTDPSGLDPSFGAKKLDCKKNFDLCRILYGSGYKDGCRDVRLRKALTTAYRVFGVEIDQIFVSLARKGKVVWGGDGFYFVKYGVNTVRLKPPHDQGCGWICSVGFRTTQVLGCGSETDCVVQGALFFTPTPAGKGTRLMKLAPKLRKALNLERKGTQAAKVAKVTGTIVKYDADIALGNLTRGGTAKASELIQFGRSQGWREVKTGAGPVKFVDKKGIERVVIKRGSVRTPGSEFPHVALRNAAGRRVDPWGNLVTKRSPGNHTPIKWDLP
ncbi:MAG: RHS repeat-associated core domain-containing protein [Gaiellaceae bacterium]